MSDLYTGLQSFFRHIARRRLTLALSGGIDSVVLLHLLARARNEWDFALNAVHIHHGLSAYADEWSAFCEELCVRQEVPLLVRRVRVNPEGLGVEAAARAARYAVFAELDTDMLALAHHADDQRETFLLAALRGGGLAAMAAMPHTRHYRGDMQIVRPLLNISRQQIADYANYHGLVWVEDDSNQNPRFLRNWIRCYLMPFAQKRLPHLSQQLDAAVWQAQEDWALFAEWLEEDWQGVCRNGFFDCVRWHGLSAPRRRRLLLEFAKRAGMGSPRRAAVENFADVLARNPQQAAEWSLPKGRIYACRGRLFACSAEQLAGWAWCGGKGVSADTLVQTGGMRWLRQPCGLPSWCEENGGVVRTVQAQDRLAVGGRYKSVKKLLQEYKVPAFVRPYWPVLTDREGRCLAVVNIGVAENIRVENGYVPIMEELKKYVF